MDIFFGIGLIILLILIILLVKIIFSYVDIDIISGKARRNYKNISEKFNNDERKFKNSIDEGLKKYNDLFEEMSKFLKEYRDIIYEKDVEIEKLKDQGNNRIVINYDSLKNFDVKTKELEKLVLYFEKKIIKQEELYKKFLEENKKFEEDIKKFVDNLEIVNINNNEKSEADDSKNSEVSFQNEEII